MPNYTVERSIVIDTNIDHVRRTLCDFKQWPIWSPWLIMESDTQLTFSEQQGLVGSHYQWQGKMTGEGSLTITAIDHNEIDMDLAFIKPFKSKASVMFELHDQGSATQLTWHMKGHMPFFLFFMTKQIKALVGMDYERGLKMLKEYLETNTVSSRVEVVGIVEQAAQPYIGIRNHSDLDSIDNVMVSDFKLLEKMLALHSQDKAKLAFALYHTFDIHQRHTEFTTALPIEQPIDVPDDFVIGTLAAQKMLKVRHTGRYDYSGNAWAAAMSYCRAEKLKINNTITGIEVYLNDPAETAPEDLVTEVLIPLKIR